jgi:hypothetical protein
VLQKTGPAMWPPGEHPLAALRNDGDGRLREIYLAECANLVGTIDDRTKDNFTLNEVP